MRRIPTLDGWRAIAILSVVLHHAATGFYARESDYWAHSLTVYGGFGVDVFFGLSGLLITKLLLEEWNAAGAVSLRGFYIRRAFRILPPYLAMLAALTAAGLWHSGREAAGCLLFFRNYVPDAMVGRWSQHLWSLAVEEHFYLLWPGLLVLCGRRRGKTVAVVLALAVGCWRMIDAQYNLGQALDVQPHFRTDLRLDALLWGCVAAFILDTARERERLTQQLRFGAWIVAAAIAGVCVIAYSLLTSMWLAALIPMLLAGTAVHPEWRVSRVLDSAPFAWVGRISYSLYLWQQLFLWPGWEHPAHWWLVWPWNVIAVFAVAAASYNLLEKPMLRIGRKLAARASASAQRIHAGEVAVQVPAGFLK
jgi:peptidoglycan/LPS O-acetylase OafA/YrhL